MLPDTISAVLLDDFLWRHDEIQRELDKLVVKDHDNLYDLGRIPDQQDKATLLSTDTSIFQLIPRSPNLKVSNSQNNFSESRNAITFENTVPMCHKALEDTVAYRWIHVIYT